MFTLRSIPDMDAIKEVVDGGATRAVVVGGGIGLKVAEVFRHRGMDVTLVEAADHVMAVLDQEMSREVEDHLEAHGVTLHLQTTAVLLRSLSRARPTSSSTWATQAR